MMKRSIFTKGALFITFLFITSLQTAFAGNWVGVIQGQSPSTPLTWRVAGASDCTGSTNYPSWAGDGVQSTWESSLRRGQGSYRLPALSADPGTYTFTCSKWDIDGRQISDTSYLVVCGTNQIWDGANCVSGTGTISASPTTCTIPVNGSSCSATLSWSTSNVTWATVWDNANSAARWGSVNGYETDYVGYETRTYYLRNGSNSNSPLLGTATVTGVCANGTVWNGSMCVYVPKGSTDGASCTSGLVWGWTCDADDYSTPLKVHVYSDGDWRTGTMRGEVTANVVRSDLSAACGGNTAHGFNFTIPNSLKDGNNHTFTTYGLNIGNGYHNELTNTVTMAGCTLSPNGTISATSCTIPAGGTRCTSTITWNAEHTSAASVYANTNLFSSNLNGSQDAPWITPTPITFSLQAASGATLATINVGASCAAGSTWDGIICNRSPSVSLAGTNTVAVGSPVTYTITGTDADSNMTELHFSWKAAGQTQWNWENSNTGGTFDTPDRYTYFTATNSKTFTINFTPTRLGTYEVYASAKDTVGYVNGGIYTLTVTCPSGQTQQGNSCVNNPKGNLDSATCSTVATGWTCDADNYSQPLNVHFYSDGAAGQGGTYRGSATANITREVGVANSCGGYAAHGFSYTIPNSLKDGNSHTLTAHALNIGGGTGNPVIGTLSMAGCTPASVPPPSNPVVSCRADGRSVTVSWTAPTGYNTFYTRASVDGVNMGAPAWDDNFVGTSKTFTVTPNKSYTWWVHTKDTSDGRWSTDTGGTFTCSNADPTATLTPGNRTIALGQPITYTIGGADSSGDMDMLSLNWMAPGQTQWSWENGALGGTVNPANYPTFTPTTSKTYDITFTPNRLGTYSVFGAAKDGRDVWGVSTIYTLTVTCPTGQTQEGNTCVNLPKGNLDSATCSTVAVGWTCDADDYSQPLSVHIYSDGAAGVGTYRGVVTANITREAAVGAQCGNYTAHGFSFTIPNSIKDGNSHTITAHGINIGGGTSNPALGTVTMAGCTPTTEPSDLTAGAVTPTWGEIGQSVSFTATISNIGAGTTNTSFSNFMQMANEANGNGTITDYSAVSMSAIAAGANRVMTKQITLPSSPGMVSVRACADKTNRSSTGSITESDENNNCGPWTNIEVRNNSTNHIITATAGSNGSISPVGSVVVADGSSQAFSITPNSGYRIATLTVDGASVTRTSTYTFSNVTRDHSINVTFEVGCSNGATDYPTCTPPATTPVIFSFTGSPRSVARGGSINLNWSIRDPNSQCRILANVQEPTTCNLACQAGRNTAESLLNSTLTSGTTNANDPNGANRTMTSALRTTVSGSFAKGLKSVQLDYTTEFTLSCGGSTTPAKTIIYVVDRNEG